MFYSKTIDEIKKAFFLNLVAHKIDGETTLDDAYIEAVVSDAVALSRCEKSFFDLDRDRYPIVVALYDLDQEYFKPLDPRQLTREDYQKIYKLLSNEPEFA